MLRRAHELEARVRESVDQQGEAIGMLAVQPGAARMQERSVDRNHRDRGVVGTPSRMPDELAVVDVSVAGPPEVRIVEDHIALI